MMNSLPVSIHTVKITRGPDKTSPLPASDGDAKSRTGKITKSCHFQSNPTAHKSTNWEYADISGTNAWVV